MNNNPNLVHYKIVEPYKNLFAFTTTQNTLAIESVRFSDIPENKLKLAEVLGVNPENLVFPKQTHSNCVAEISSVPEKPIDNTDALITNKPGLCICIQTADCVPVLLFDPLKNVVSSVHAGWRGTVGNIVGVAIQKMVSKYNCSAENIMAAIGPSISAELYEVGGEVVKAARKAIPNVEQTLHKSNSGKYHLNLWEANRQHLINCGLKANNIEILGECSFQEKEKYYSARRDGIETGRMVSGIMIL